MRIVLFILLGFFLSCSTEPLKKKQKKVSGTPDPVVSQELQKACDEVLIAFSRAQILSQRTDTPSVYVKVEGKKSPGTISLYEILSNIDGKIDLGKCIHIYKLPENITFMEAKRNFWYDLGKIQFLEKDQRLRHYDHPPSADLILIHKKNGDFQRGLIDFIKNTSQIQTLIYPQ